jgi:hypothetical protein
VIADLDARDAGADRLDDSRSLVAADIGQLGRQVTGHQVHVGMTQSRRHVADQDLVIAGIPDIHVEDLPRLTDSGQYGGLALHRSLSWSALNGSP